MATLRQIFCSRATNLCSWASNLCSWTPNLCSWAANRKNIEGKQQKIRLSRTYALRLYFSRRKSYKPKFFIFEFLNFYIARKGLGAVSRTPDILFPVLLLFEQWRRVVRARLSVAGGQVFRDRWYRSSLPPDLWC